MNRRITLHVQMRLLSDTILGAGYSIPGGEDIAVCKDQNGYPYLKGSTLKGLLRESIENWLVWTGGCEADIDALMGASGWVGLTDSRRVQFSEFQMQNPPATPEECYETRTFTSLTDAGTVESGTLRMAACIRRNAIFVGEIDCAGEDEALMKNALASIKWVGTMRSRGFGRVQFAVERSTERNDAVWETGTGTCIRYLLHTDSPVMMTDLTRSKDNSYETREYIPGSAIRGLVVGKLAKEMLSGLRDLVDNPTPRVPVLLCLDTSGSMVGDPIRELNLGVQQFLTEMKGDDLTRCSAETAVVAFNDSASCVADFDTADKLLVPEMEAEGMTCMGEGLSLALDLLEKRKAKYKATGVDYYQPILVVMSDGLPNGNRRVWDEAVERIRALCASRKLSVVVVGIGNDADMEMLARVSPKQRPVRLNGLRFREFFAWLSRSVTNVTASLPGDEPSMDLDALQALSAEPWPEDTL